MRPPPRQAPCSVQWHGIRFSTSLRDALLSERLHLFVSVLRASSPLLIASAGLGNINMSSRESIAFVSKSSSIICLSISAEKVTFGQLIKIHWNNFSKKEDRVMIKLVGKFDLPRRALEREEKGK